MSRDNILHRVRTALGRSDGEAAATPPSVRIRLPEVDPETRIASFRDRLEALAGKYSRAATPEDAREVVAAMLNGRSAVCSNSPYLVSCGISSLPSVSGGFFNREELSAACATTGVGITSADFALADTGTLVMLSSPRETRLISLLPPAHIAVLPAERILSGLDELFSLLPNPGEVSSSMVLITGPSRTADIEQILVRGVHGPGEIAVVIVG